MLPVPRPTARIELAAEPPFVLGPVDVVPARRQVGRDGAMQTVEPRVMQVLVALGRAPGQVVGRDELVDLCWDGRIVGENAIQRVISRIRQLAGRLGGFEIETITKVGYRLTVPIEPTDRPAMDVPMPGTAPVAPLRRRFVLGGVAALVVGSIAAGRVRDLAVGPANSAAATEVAAAAALVAKAREAELAGLPGSGRQSIAFLKRATELDPGSARAWGALGLAYQQQMDMVDDASLASLGDWARAASRRALALDAGNPDAQLALVGIRPNFRNWAVNEPPLRALATRNADHAASVGALGWLLCDVGRWREAIACFRHALALAPYHPTRQIVLAWGLWGGGELAEAERLLEDAARLWPGDQTIWMTRFEFYATMGQPDRAMAQIADVAARPLLEPGGVPPAYAALHAFAVAMGSRAPADIAAATRQVAAARRDGAIGSNSAAVFFGALGAIDAAFDGLDRYYFGVAGRGPGVLSRRKTSILFSAKSAPLRASPRYAPLTRRLGLIDYWQKSGIGPDRRR